MFQLRNVVDPATREVIKNPNRQDRPMVRRPGASEWEDITWDDGRRRDRALGQGHARRHVRDGVNGITVNRCHGIASLGGSSRTPRKSTSSTR